MPSQSRHSSPRKASARHTLGFHGDGTDTHTFQNPNSTFPSPSTLPPSDVETTNWNAVKMLASKYGIILKSASEVQNSALAKEQGEVDGQDPACTQTEPEDLGVGTPFSITATRLEGGRFIYRFKWRGSTTSKPSADQSASSSAGLDFNPGHIDPTEAFFSFPRSTSSGAIVSGCKQQVGTTQSLFRKSGQLMLKSSRSIPVLRSKAPANYNRTYIGGDAAVAWLPMGGPLGPSAGQSSKSTSAADPSSVEALGRGFASSSKNGASPSAVSMARAKSTPVNGAYVPRNWTGRLEEGDVLGAILGLRQEEVWMVSRTKDRSEATGAARASKFNAHQAQADSSLTDKSQTTSFHGHTGPSSPDSTQIDGTKVPLNVPPFGSEVVLQPEWTAKGQQQYRGKDASPATPLQGDRLTAEDRQVNFASSSSQPTLPELDLGSKFAKSPRLHQLREAPSFTSTASNATARETAEEDKYPPEILSLLESRTEGDEESGIFIYDVLQHYLRPSRNAPMPQAPAVAPSNGSTHRRFTSAEVLKSLTGKDDAQKHFIAEAQALPTSAAPGDDPRFAIWAVRSDRDDGAFILSGRNGDVNGRSSIKVEPSGRSSVQPLSNKRRSGKVVSGGPARGSDNLGSESSSRNSTNSGKSKTSKASRDSTLFPPRKAILLGATATRLIAELTSEIDQDLLTDFFYTFREYLDPVELLRLLTLRFDWAVAEASSAQDEARRRIVRVRSYVVIKYWLLNHFEFDFLPNRQLRQNLVNWLNTVAKDQRMTSRPADLSIIKSLRKVVRGLKDTYSQTGVGALLFNDAGRLRDDDKSQQGSSGSSRPRSGVMRLDHSFHSESSQEGTPSSPRVGDDIDLDFASDDVTGSDKAASPGGHGQVAGSGSNLSSSNEGIGAARAAAMKASAESVVLSPTRQPVMRTRPTTASHSPNIITHSPQPLPLPHAHSAISRVFVHTVGRLSRFKRVLGSRGGLLPNASDHHYEDLEFEANDSGDLLFIRGGLENFIYYFNLGGQGNAPPEILSGSEDERGCQVSDSTGQDETPSLSTASAERSTPASSIDLSRSQIEDWSKLETGLGIEGMDDVGESAQPSHELELGALESLSPAHRGAENLHHTTSDQTLRSFSQTEGPTSVACRASSRASNRVTSRSVRMSVRSSGPRIVQIDDIDLSSDEDDGAVRRALRRLPGARDLRLANNVRDLEPVRQSIDSMASSFAYGRALNSSMHPRTKSVDSLALPSVIGTVQSEMLDPDEALQGYELVKGFQLDGMDSDDEEPGDVEAALRRLEGIIDEEKQRENTKKVERLWQKSVARNAEKETPTHPADRQLFALLADNEEDLSGSRDLDSKDDDDEEEPREELQDFPASFLEMSDDDELSKRSSQMSYDAQRSPAPQRATLLPSAAPPPTAWKHSKLTQWPFPPVHRSFLLSYRSEVISHQMTLIESELLCSVSWDELSSSRWKERRYASEVTNWETFYRDRVRDRLEAQRLHKPYKDCGVEAIVARFNLTSNWVASEVVLTQNLDERVAVVSKLIRIAWKCYLQSNFASLAQIIFGLSTPWVERLRRTWARVGYYEMRIWRDLNSFVGPRNNFKYLRMAMERDEGGCIPFFGLFLSDLIINDALPCHLDPTSPNTPLGKEGFANPSAFSALPPLPPNIPLDPLVNIYKYRIVASTIKSVLSFQERSKIYRLEADASVYVKCLKIRCLQGEQLAQISHVVEA